MNSNSRQTSYGVTTGFSTRQFTQPAPSAFQGQYVTSRSFGSTDARPTDRVQKQRPTSWTSLTEAARSSSQPQLQLKFGQQISPLPASTSGTFVLGPGGPNELSPDGGEAVAPLEGSVIEVAAKTDQIEVQDLDEEEDRGDVQLKSATNQMTREEGHEKLHEVFLGMSVDGVIPFKDIRALLIAADAPGTPTDYDTAIQKFFANMDDNFMVEYELILNLYKYLVAQADDSGANLVGTEHMGWFARHASRMSDLKATNVLLVIVVAVSFLSAFLVAGLAILLMIIISGSVQDSNMLGQAGTFKDIIHVFAADIFKQQIDSRIMDATTIVSAVASFVSFETVLEMEKKDLQYMATFMGQGVDAWWDAQPKDTFENIARVMALWTEVVVERSTEEKAIKVTDVLNDLLPAGYEVNLGRWANGSDTLVEYLTRFRYASECPNGTCHYVTNAEATPMKYALSTKPGALQARDYRLKDVMVGYARSAGGIGVEYKLDTSVFAEGKYTQMNVFFDGQNSEATDSREFLLGRLKDNGQVELLTEMQNCDEKCLAYAVRPEGSLGKALRGETGTIEEVSYDGTLVISTYVPIPSAKMAMVVQMAKAERVARILDNLAGVFDDINAKTKNSQEIELSSILVEDGKKKAYHLSKYRFECPKSGCLESEYITRSMEGCTTGVTRTTDYRGKAVAVGYSCMENLQAVVSVKLDMDEIDVEGLGIVVDAVNSRNAIDAGTSHQFMVAQLNEGVDRTGNVGYDDFKLLSELKYRDQCVNKDCQWDMVDARRAVMNQAGLVPGVMSATDYRGRAVQSAVDFDESIGGGVGLIMEIDQADYLANIFETTWIVMTYTFCVVFVSCIGIVAMTKKNMRDMVTASAEGKRAIEKEKQRFATLVTSMYPNYVVPRLLAGERHIVSEVPHAAVFFSDIYEFTSASNTLGSEDLLLFMCYTYGLMDEVANRHGVYKVKTIGDAYLAVAGLPGTHTKTACLDLLRFASCIAQIFSCRFGHPEKGKILQVVFKTMSWNRGKNKANASNKHKGSTLHTNSEHQSQISDQRTGTESVGPSEASRSTAQRALALQADQVSCLMSYGLATGPIIAGVLQGKSPMFDIWGKIVNLASRMESTGQPGRIQVSERFYKKVIGIAAQPFSFEHPHSTFCKGFGNVNSYFVRSTAEPPPKDLLIELGLEPRYGLYYFDNVLTKTQQPAERVPGQAQVL